MMPELPSNEPPKTEPPKSEPPKTELPITEPPKSEPPKSEPPKSEPPKSEPPKSEPPKSEPPKESPKKEEAKPAGTAHESVQPPTTAAAQFEELAAPRNSNAVVMTVDSQEAAQGRAEHGAHRVASISSTAPGLPTRSVQKTAFNVVEPSSPVVNASAKGGQAAPLAIAGYCPVELVRNGRWVQGDARFTVAYRGCAYRMASAAQLQQFKANPELFTPVDSGNDVVLALDEHKTVSGTVAYCATYNGRLYMFSSPATQTRFNQNPLRYAAKK
jgi:YHS domain-containing protein